MSEPAPALLPLFRSRSQLGLLAELLINPGPARSVSELARATGVTKAAASHELDRLERAGIVRSERRGRLRLVEANPDLPYFSELRTMLLKTMGPATVIRAALDGIDGIDEAYIFGSWAARYNGEEGPPPHDIDLVVIGEPDLDRLYAACREAGRELSTDIQPVVRSRSEWERADESLLAHVKSRPLVRVL